MVALECCRNLSNSPSIFQPYLHSSLAPIAHESFFPLAGRYFTTFSEVLLNFFTFFPHIKEGFPLVSMKPFGPGFSQSFISCRFSSLLLTFSGVGSSSHSRRLQRISPSLVFFPSPITFVLLPGKKILFMIPV